MYESPDATLVPVVGVAAFAGGLDLVIAALIVTVVASVVVFRHLRRGRNAAR